MNLSESPRSQQERWKEMNPYVSGMSCVDFRTKMPTTWTDVIVRFKEFFEARNAFVACSHGCLESLKWHEALRKSSPCSYSVLIIHTPKGQCAFSLLYEEKPATWPNQWKPYLLLSSLTVRAHIERKIQCRVPELTPLWERLKPSTLPPAHQSASSVPSRQNLPRGDCDHVY